MFASTIFCCNNQIATFINLGIVANPPEPILCLFALYTGYKTHSRRYLQLVINVLINERVAKEFCD